MGDFMIDPNTWEGLAMDRTEWKSAINRGTEKPEGALRSKMEEK